MYKNNDIWAKNEESIKIKKGSDQRVKIIKMLTKTSIEDRAHSVIYLSSKTNERSH